jgi:HlyD family secretion protein
MKRTRTFHQLFIGATCLILFASCNHGNQVSDAYGNFEAQEVIVSAQSQGVLIYLYLDEGKLLEKNQLVGKIDTIPFNIKENQLRAQLTVSQAKLQNLETQLRVQEVQRINLAREVDRIRKLYEDQAATQKQVDDMQGQLDVLDRQIDATRSQQGIIRGEKEVIFAQLAEVNNQLEKCSIINPIKGTVLEKYSEPGELVVPGKSIYKIANLDEMELKVYVSGSQLPEIKIGDSVTVIIDDPETETRQLSGTISWISDEVEFTPKIIQTREERVSMVYAVKVMVKNDGRLKIGMPGEVRFK